MRYGADAFLPKRLPRDEDDTDASPGHKLMPVYREMLLQCCSDYPGLPDARSLSMTEIRFFYDGLRGALKKHTTPKQKR